jgi:hypothetical protein
VLVGPDFAHLGKGVALDHGVDDATALV